MQTSNVTAIVKDKTESDLCPVDDEAKSHFVVKVQIPLDGSRGFLMVYNKTRSVLGYLSPSTALHEPIFQTVSERGLQGGIKGFFNARIEGGELQVNPFDMAEAQPW